MQVNDFINLLWRPITLTIFNDDKSINKMKTIPFHKDVYNYIMDNPKPKLPPIINWVIYLIPPRLLYLMEKDNRHDYRLVPFNHEYIYIYPKHMYSKDIYPKHFKWLTAQIIQW